MEDDVFKQFREHSVAEFFKKNRQMLGFSGKVRSLTMIVHEFVTNGLDACEEAGILPEISVQVEELGKDHYKVTISDNGPGIPKSHLGKALGQMLAGTKFHRYIQQRGQQGIGAAACTMFSYITTGQSTKAITSHGGKKLTAIISMDFKKNKPIIEVTEETDTEEHGLTVISEYKDVRYERSNYGIFEYLRRTALANPHCTISLIEPNNEKTVFPRSVEINPKKAYEIKPHPLGIKPHDLLEFAKHSVENKRISSFLQNTFARVSAAKVEDLKSMLPEIDFNKRPDKMSWEDAEAIVGAIENVKWIAPSTDSLVPIGREQVEASFRNIFNPEVLVITQRSPKVYRGGIPFSVEVGIAYGGGVAAANKRGEVMRFANKVPLLFDAGGCAITETIKTIDWKRYNIRNFDEEPIAVLVNVVSVHVPYTSAGKQALSSEEDLMAEIKFAVMEASRGIQRFISGRKKANEIATKKKVVSRYIEQLSNDLASLTQRKPERIAKELREIVEEKYVDTKKESIKPPEKPKANEDESNESGEPDVNEGETNE
ncbi:DNA topoisomerase VI subunit B [Candidatus Micrarchaeota archaeon]|nr:DNA topoisomerase VI subunit B [Candidatus Micrarchaeota archaeon]MBU1681817.1 DNA topoisomerase VI subunit B [Candidatus Micrarchaeota archaeon]